MNAFCFTVVKAVNDQVKVLLLLFLEAKKTIASMDTTGQKEGGFSVFFCSGRCSFLVLSFTTSFARMIDVADCEAE